MNSDIAIKVEGLGKEYIIGHQKSSDFRNSFNDKINSLLGRNTEKESFWALKDINFEIKKGEAVGIIGRNGAGKSTLLKILSRITEPTKGRFEINGRVSSLLEVGTGFHMELTGRENIFLNGTILGMKRSEIKAKFDEIVEFSGVSKFLDTPVKHYSSGMKVRLAFSVAAHLEPEILIIDEVLAVGDAEFQKKCLGKMDEVSKNEGRTVIFVSHNMGAVQNLCQNGIVLSEGIQVANLPVKEAISFYQNTASNYLGTDYKQLYNKNSQKEFEVINFLTKNQFLAIEESFISGDQIIFELEYKLHNSSSNSDIAIGLVVKNSNGQFLTVLNNKIKGQTLSLSKNTQNSSFITCTLKSAPFMFGELYVDLIVQYKGEIIYSLMDALKFNITEGDFFGSGFPNSKNREGIYIDHEWDSK